MSRIFLLGTLILCGCGDPVPVQISSPIESDCRGTSGDGTICAVGSAQVGQCIIFHEADRGEYTVVTTVPRPDIGCIFNGSYR